MSYPKVPLPVKLIVSVIFASEDQLPSLGTELTDLFGQIDFVSERFPFDHTSYYEEEMGMDLKRVFISFGSLVPRDILPTVKMRTNKMERRYANPYGKRKINLDPGILTLQNFVLASGKDFSHRIYLADGIYGDLTLLYRSKTFVPLQWTYPDYASNDVIQLLNGLRRRYLYQIRGLERTGKV